MKSTDETISKAKIAATENMVLPSSISTGYMHIEPDSHFYTDLAQIEESLRLGLSQEHMLIGIRNSIKMGYSITLELDCE